MIFVRPDVSRIFTRNFRRNRCTLFFFLGVLDSSSLQYPTRRRTLVSKFFKQTRSFVQTRFKRFQTLRTRRYKRWRSCGDNFVNSRPHDLTVKNTHIVRKKLTRPPLDFICILQTHKKCEFDNDRNAYGARRVCGASIRVLILRFSERRV